MGTTLKGKKLLPGGANSFLSRPLFQKGHGAQGSKQEITKDVSLEKTENHGSASDLLSLYAHHFSLIRIFTARVQDIVIL